VPNKNVVKKTNIRRRSDKGENTAQLFLAAAETILIDQGYANLSMRKVANLAGLTLGNLQYYFPSKEALVNTLLDNCIQGYLDRFERIRAHAGTDPEEQFRSLIKDILLDLNTKKTTVFFPEVWSLANHDKTTSKSLDNMYQKYRLVLIEVITLINPALSNEQVRRAALFFSASMEGHTIFVGHDKPWKKETMAIIQMATESFLWLIKSKHIPI
jgi:AcrR family transcriptional regulator